MIIQRSVQESPLRHLWESNTRSALNCGLGGQDNPIPNLRQASARKYVQGFASFKVFWGILNQGVWQWPSYFGGISSTPSLQSTYASQQTSTVADVLRRIWTVYGKKTDTWKQFNEDGSIYETYTGVSQIQGPGNAVQMSGYPGWSGLDHDDFTEAFYMWPAFPPPAKANMFDGGWQTYFDPALSVNNGISTFPTSDTVLELKENTQDLFQDPPLVWLIQQLTSTLSEPVDVAAIYASALADFIGESLSLTWADAIWDMEWDEWRIPTGWDPFVTLYSSGTGIDVSGVNPADYTGAAQTEANGTATSSVAIPDLGSLPGCWSGWMLLWGDCTIHFARGQLQWPGPGNVSYSLIKTKGSNLAEFPKTGDWAYSVELISRGFLNPGDVVEAPFNSQFRGTGPTLMLDDPFPIADVGGTPIMNEAYAVIVGDLPDGTIGDHYYP